MTNDSPSIDVGWDSSTPASGTQISIAATTKAKALAPDERNLKVIVKDPTIRMLRARAAMDDVILSIAADAALVRGLTPVPKIPTNEELLAQTLKSLNKTAYDRWEVIRAARHCAWSTLITQALEALLEGKEPLPPPRPTPKVPSITTRNVPWDGK